MVNNVEMVCFS